VKLIRQEKNISETEIEALTEMDRLQFSLHQNSKVKEQRAIGA
jgi:tRNA G10  N-methylase Trm11